MEVEEKLRLITVRIEAEVGGNQRNSILGSGVLWAPDDKNEHMYVFTAAHVVYGHSKLVIRYWSKDENSKTIDIDDENNIVLHEQNNYSEYLKDKSVLLKNDVAVLRCTIAPISYLNYKLKTVRNIKREEALILRGFPKKIYNTEDSITSGIEIEAKYDLADGNKKSFCYKIDEDLKCEERNEELEGLSGSGIFLKNEQLMLIGIHSYGVDNLPFKRVTGMNIELVRDICQMKKWDMPKLSTGAERTHTIPTAHKWEVINDDFLENHSKYNDEKLKDFLIGQKCTWGLISNNCTIKREATETALSKIISKKIIGILGAAGEGKSTILMQLCKELNTTGYTVYWNTEQINRTLHNMELQSTTDLVVLVIDDASGDVEFEKFALQAANKGYKIVFAARENEWNLGRMKAESAELERELELIELKNVTEAEAEKFAHLIFNKMNINKEESEIKKIFIENNNGFLLAAMLMAVYGRPLQEIVNDVLIKIKKQSEDVLKVLAIICFIEDLESRIKKNINFTTELYRILYSSYGIKKKEINILLHKEVQKTNLNIMRTRHPLISNIILEFLIRKEDAEFELGDLLYDFVTCFYKVENNNGKKIIPTDIFNSIYPMMRVILKDIYINSTGFVRQDIARNIAEMYPSRGDIWQLWAGLETDQGNIGLDVDEEYSARWILKKGSEKCFLYGDIYNKWAELEIEQGNIGQDINEENSARWILKEGSKKCILNGAIYIKWSNLEIEEGNIGQNINEENSARWILKEGSKKCLLNGSIYIKWSNFETEEGNIGKNVNEENSARWILKEGSKKCPLDGSIYIKWSNFEIEEGNIGKDVNEENSARWILKEGSKKCPLDGSIYIKWAELEIKQGNIGQDINEENSARWILKEGSKKCPFDATIYEKWVELEIEQDNIGQHINEENSVRWILNECITNNMYYEQMWLLYSKVEVNFNNDEKAISISIESLKFHDKNLFLLALLQAKNKNFSPEDPYSAKSCIDKVLKSYENARNLYVAYLCYKLYDSEELGERYKEKLSQTDIEIFKQEKFFKIKQWEEGWIERNKLECI